MQGGGEGDVSDHAAATRSGPGQVARRRATQGAALASLLILAAATWRDGLDPLLVAAALAGTGLSYLLGGPPAETRRTRALVAAGRRLAVAEALLAHIPDPVILVDRRAVVVEMNGAAATLLPGLKLGHPLSFALRSPDVLDGITEVLRSGEAHRVEYTERVPTERSFEVLIGPFSDPAPTSDQGARVVLVFRDLTSARRLEHMRVDFVANASHELRTPLATLLGFIDTLQGPARNDAAARDRFLAIMREQASRMARLIDDLLSLSRIELRAHLPPQDVVDLASVVPPILDALQPMARDGGKRLVLVPAEGPLPVRGDRDELSRVVENLVENAIKYGGSTVTVRLARSEPAGTGEAELQVHDDGSGIPPEHLPRLTERFYRVDAGASRQRGGTGLGLAIVKHIVARHRGRLSVESGPGAGTSFRVSLPVVEGAASGVVMRTS